MLSLSTLLQIPAVSSYYFEANFDSATDAIVEKYQLPYSRADELLDLMNAVLDGKIKAADMAELLAEAFGVTPPTAQKIAADLIGKTMLPLAHYVPGLEECIQAYGERLEEYTAVRIPRGTSDLAAMVTQAASQTGISLDDVLAKRLLFLLQQYAKTEKTEESLKTFFIRPTSIGGLGLQPEQASALLQVSLPLAPLLLEFSQSAPATLVTPAPQLEDEFGLQIPPSPPAEHQDLTVAPNHEVMIKPDVHPASRGVTGSTSLVSAPTPQPVAVKALKPLAALVPKLTLTPEAVVDKQELKATAKKAEEAKKLTAPVQNGLTAALGLAVNNAKDTLKKFKVSEKVFADLADKAIRGIRDIYQTRDIAERDWKVTGQDLAKLMQAITAGIDAYHKSAPMPDAPKPTLASIAPKADDQKLNERFVQLTQANADLAVPPAKAQLTVGSNTPQTPDGQKRVVDVMNSPRLAGPVEQLGSMTPTEFRRLSSNPTEACQKIQDLLTALESTSYEDRVKGVLAWRESPMNQLYLQITEEALSQGLALPEVSSRRRSAGQESLSPAEIKALALLNNKIRF